MRQRQPMTLPWLLAASLMKRPNPRPVPEACPVCSALVPRGARACPGCGSDERTGWSESAAADGLDLPDESFDYDAFVARELEGRPPRRPMGRLWAVTAVVLLAVLIWWFGRGLF